MADYYPLLARALETIREPTAEARQAVYGRARTALLKQLRSLQPPLPESEIERERAALDDAIERAEAAHADPPATYAAPSRGSTGSFEEPDEPDLDEDLRSGRPPTIRRGGRQNRPRLMALALVAAIAPIAAAAWLYRDRPTATPPNPSQTAGPPAAEVTTDPKFGDRVAGDESPRPRPAAPPQAAPPQAAPPQAAPQAAPLPSGAPASGAPPAPPPRLIAQVPTPSSPPLPPVQVAPAAPPITATPVTPSTPLSPGTSLRLSNTASPASPAAPPSEPSPVSHPDIAIAQRALIAEQNTAEPQTPKITSGRAIWRSDVLDGGQGQPLEMAVRAQIDVPEAGLSLLLTLQRNRDAAFTATSHTMELQFTSMRGAETGRNVRDVGQMQMRVDEATSGTRIAGLSVLVKENVFLVALSSLATEVERNRELLLTRNWIELPIRFASGQRAALLFEKGASGERILAEAFRQWAQP